MTSKPMKQPEIRNYEKEIIAHMPAFAGGKLDEETLRFAIVAANITIAQLLKSERERLVKKLMGQVNLLREEYDTDDPFDDGFSFAISKALNVIDQLTSEK